MSQSSGGKIKKFIVSFVPKYIKNGAVIGFYELLRVLCIRSKRKSFTRLEHNLGRIGAHLESIRSRNGYIEDQSNYEDMAFGRVTVKYAGCEIIAVYNVINSLLKRELITFPEMIRHFEMDGMALGGRFGTAPKAILDFFKKNNFKTEFSSKKEDFDRISQEFQSLILTMYNDGENLGHQIHTIAITKENNGFVGHNVNGNGRCTKPFRTLGEFMDGINGGRSKGISIIGISIPENVENTSLT